MKHTPMIPRRVAGFTLVEIAVVILIIALLATAIAVPLATQVQQRRYEETRKLLETAKEALLGFAAANGRLPCPASAISNGQESFCDVQTGACTPTTAFRAHGKCSNFYNNSFLPGATLGLAPLDSQGYVVDAWGIQQNRIRYAVMDSSTSHSLTAASGMKNATISALGTRDYLYLCASGTGVTTTCGAVVTNLLTNKAPFVLISLGPNAPTGGTGTDEAKNLDNDPVFVTHDPAPASAANGEFDDIVTWVSLNTLFSRMLTAGALP